MIRMRKGRPLDTASVERAVSTNLVEICTTKVDTKKKKIDAMRKIKKELRSMVSLYLASL